MQRSSVIFASLFSVGLLSIAWQEYYPPSALLDVVGVNGPRARSGRRCDAGYLHRSFWTHPTRVVMCFNPGAFSSRFTPHDLVRLDAVTRRVVSATRMWVEPDSTSWAKDVDSVSRGLEAMGGAPYTCKFSPTFAPPSSWVYWRVRGYFVRVSALGAGYADITPYQINIDGRPDVPDECLHPPRTREPSNACSEATVRVPLPGRYEWCWQSPFGL